MSTSVVENVEPLLTVHGSAADYLYREGSAKASFWEALFGSSLSARRRTHVSALPDGTRRFEVPLREVGDGLLRDAAAWFNAPVRADACREAAAALAANRVRVTLVGLQPGGQAVANFALGFEGVEAPSPAVASSFRAWFASEASRLGREILVPFGFTPHS